MRRANYTIRNAVNWAFFREHSACSLRILLQTRHQGGNREIVPSFSTPLDRAAGPMGDQRARVRRPGHAKGGLPEERPPCVRSRLPLEGRREEGRLRGRFRALLCHHNTEKPAQAYHLNGLYCGTQQRPIATWNPTTRSRCGTGRESLLVLRRAGLRLLIGHGLL